MTLRGPVVRDVNGSPTHRGHKTQSEKAGTRRRLIPPKSLLEFQAFDSAVQAMKEKLRRSLLSRERLDVLDGLVQPRMRVVFLPAVATSPAAIILFDDAEEPGHRTSIRLAASLKEGRTS